MIEQSLLEIPGWMGEPEMRFLYQWVHEAPPDALIVELGTWKGRSTSQLYTGMHSDQAVVTVDTWLGQEDLRFESHSEVLSNDVFLEFMEYMSQLDIHPQWYTPGKLGPCYLRMFSSDAATLFPDGSLHRIFIDCDHTAVGEDLDIWLPKMAPDGEVSGHDYNWVGVQDQVEQRIQITEVIADLWVAAPIVRK